MSELTVSVCPRGVLAQCNAERHLTSLFRVDQALFVPSRIVSDAIVRIARSGVEATESTDVR